MSSLSSPSRSHSATRPTGRSPARYVASPAGDRTAARGTTDQIGAQNGVRRDVPRQFGDLAPLLAADGVTDLFVNARGDVWIDRGGGTERVRAADLDPADVRRLAVGLVGLGGRHLDDSCPVADVRLADGLRVHAVLPPISPGGTVLSVRVPTARPLDLDELEARGMFDVVPRRVLVEHVRGRSNLLISGATGSGKTTLLGALLGEAPPTERLVTLEDVAELRIDHPHVVGLEVRQANIEGAGLVDLARLVREALRMRPDRLIVGECRGPELRELLSALSTGHAGGAGTLHANGVSSVPARLEALGAVAGLDPAALARQAAAAFDLVVHVEATAQGRRVAAIARLVIDRGGRLEAAPVARDEGGAR